MQQLKYLQMQYSNLPEQGTDAWLQSRRTKIGGSEIASVLGKCPYKSYSKYIEDKKANAFKNNAACTFGHLLEPVAKHIMEEEQGIKIHEMGAIPATNFPICYSPDGVIVRDDKLILLEIKCPFRRYKLSVIPPHYLNQVKTGMCVLPCHECEFHQFRFRICKAHQINKGVEYNRWMHTEARKRVPDCIPLRWGYFHFHSKCKMHDLGQLRKETSDDLVYFKNWKHTIYYEKSELPKTGYVLGWKLFEMTSQIIDRDPMFLEDNKEKIWEAFAELTKKSSD